MTYFAVTREAGPRWTEGHGAFDQPRAGAHAAFMNRLAEEGVVLLAGPLDGSELDRIRVLLIARARSGQEVRDRLAADPWVMSERRLTTSVEPWRPIVGGDKLAL